MLAVDYVDCSLVFTLDNENWGKQLIAVNFLRGFLPYFQLHYNIKYFKSFFLAKALINSPLPPSSLHHPTYPPTYLLTSINLAAPSVIARGQE